MFCIVNNIAIIFKQKYWILCESSPNWN